MEIGLKNFPSMKFSGLQGSVAATPSNTPSNTPVPSAPIQQGFIPLESIHESSEILAKKTPNRKGKGMTSHLEQRMSHLKAHDSNEETEEEEEEEEEDHESTNPFASLPYSVQRLIKALKNSNDRIISLEYEFREKIVELEREYEKKMSPYLEEQRRFINGEKEPTDAEALRESDNEEYLNEHVQGFFSEVKGIPYYWLSAMRNHYILDSLIEEHDVPILNHLENISSTILEDNPGFKLEFSFGDNPYFSNQILTRTFWLSNTDVFTVEKDFNFSGTEGCSIRWKPGKNVTRKIVKEPVKKQTGRRDKSRSGSTRTYETSVPSFFNFFASSNPDEEYSEELYEIGEAFRSLTRHSVQFFCEPIMDETDDHYDDVDEENEYEEEDEEEEEEEEDMSTRNRSGHRHHPRNISRF
jgi:nucleosome assembly protein 1-like 1